MKIARFFAVVFAVVGIVLMLGTAILCLMSTDAPVRLLETPTEAVDCSERFVNALDSGDFAGASALTYGQPQFGAEGSPEDPINAMLWQAYLDSVECELTGKLYLEGSDFARKASVTVLDIDSVTASLQQRAAVLLNAEVASATDMDALYDESNNFRRELVDKVMQQAAEAALREDAQTVTRDVVIRLVHRDGQWWALPDEALLDTLSGSAA